MESQTFYTQEMLKKGYLVGASIYATNAYTTSIINRFGEHTKKVFEQLSQYLKDGILLDKIEGPIIETGFKRLN